MHNRYGIIFLKTKDFPTENYRKEKETTERQKIRDMKLGDNVLIFRTFGWADYAILYRIADFPRLFELKCFWSSLAYVLEVRGTFGIDYENAKNQWRRLSGMKSIAITFIKRTPYKAYSGNGKRHIPSSALTPILSSPQKITDTIKNELHSPFIIESMGWEDLIILSELREKFGDSVYNIRKELEADTYSIIGFRGAVKRTEVIDVIMSIKVKKEKHDIVDWIEDLKKIGNTSIIYPYDCFGWYDLKLHIKNNNVSQLLEYVNIIRKKKDVLDTCTEVIDEIPI
jgi:hypothetical protein